MTEPVEFLHEFCEFGEHRGYILWAKARKKENDELTHSTELIHRRVIESADEIEYNYKLLRSMLTAHPGYEWRIYVTVNARDLLSAYFNYRNRMNEWSEDIVRGHEPSADKISRVDSEWRSTVHNPSNKDDQYFQFDVDEVSKDEIRMFCDELGEHTTTELVRETPNGYHVISEPFNYNNFDPSIEYDSFDRDGQLHVQVFNT